MNLVGPSVLGAIHFPLQVNVLTATSSSFHWNEFHVS